MKQDSTLIILLVSFLLVFSGAYIFLESQQQSLNDAEPPAAASQPAQETTGETESAASQADIQPQPTDTEIEAVPTLSEDADLETVERELEQTKILEEEFDDL